MTFAPRDYQIASAQSIWDYFNNGGNGHPAIALPTGTGKSLIPPMFIHGVMQLYPNQRFMVLTHVKELIDNNAKKMEEVWPSAPMGIYSAGLRVKDTQAPIIFGGIASVFRNIEIFGHRDIVFIDECHLLNPNASSMYQTVLNKLMAFNPWLKVVGLTATPFRLGQGRITDGGLFTEIIYNGCNLDAFNRFIAQGWLSPPIPKRPRTELDVSNVGIQNGDYKLSQLQAAVNIDGLTKAVCQEMCEHGHDRKSWLVFCSGIEHAEKVATALQFMGVSAAAIHSKLSDSDRDDRISRFKSGDLRCVTNNNVLTTGFDHPAIDFIGMLRPTQSPGLWVQMLGRGTRPAPDKKNCLVLDFAGNTRRLGPINDPVIPTKKGPGNGDAPVKICDQCGTYNHASVRFCVECGAEFHFQTKIVKTADTQTLIRGDFPIFADFDVDRVLYVRHESASGVGIRVSYYCGMRMFEEFLQPFATKALPRHRARDWWRQRSAEEIPETIEDWLKLTYTLREPKQIKVWLNKKYPEVMSYEW
jgi:DNA repair protein RadD